jgi:hypothetical protein
MFVDSNFRHKKSLLISVLRAVGLILLKQEGFFILSLQIVDSIAKTKIYKKYISGMVIVRKLL